MGMGLETWVLETRKRLVASARGAHLALGRRAQAAGNLQTAVHHAEAGLLVVGAPPPERAEIEILAAILTRATSPLLSRLRAEVASLGLEFSEFKPKLPTNLPAPPIPFIGRDRERNEVITVICRNNACLITLHGPGGIGKTSLAAATRTRTARDGHVHRWRVLHRFGAH